MPFLNLTKSLIFDLTKILLPNCLVLTYSLIAKVMHYQIPFSRIEIELLVFKLYLVLSGQSFSKLSSGCSSDRKSEKVNRQQPRSVPLRPIEKIPISIKWLISSVPKMINQICKKYSLEKS